jgi:predicted lipoprotein
MKKKIKWIVWLVLIAAFLVWGSKQFTVVNTQEQTAVLESEKFDRVAYVDAIWESKLLPAVREDSKELPIVLDAIAKDLESSAEFAKISVSGAYNYRVRGVGTVEAVDLSKKDGKATIRLDGYNGNIQVFLNIGPKISGESIRDGAGFIDFGNFKDQTEYGQVSKEINKRVGTEIFEKFDWANMIGKKISFGGMFTILTTNQTKINLDTVTISPVYVEEGD